MAYLIGGRLYIVADGVSGGMQPERASRIAVQVVGQTYYALIQQLLTADVPDWPSLTELGALLRRAVYAAQCRLIEESESLRAELSEESRTSTNYLETTCSCLLLRGRELITAHVGDSPIELWREGQLVPLVAAHLNERGQPARLLGADLAEGDIEIHQADNWPKSPAAGKLQTGDILVACTDGLSKFLAAEQRAEILEVPKPDRVPLLL